MLLSSGPLAVLTGSRGVLRGIYGVTPESAYMRVCSHRPIVRLRSDNTLADAYANALADALADALANTLDNARAYALANARTDHRRAGRRPVGYALP
jgi:hypothetical protein